MILRAKLEDSTQFFCWPGHSFIVMCNAARNSGSESSTASFVEARFMTVVEADVHRVDIINARSTRRIQSSSNASPVKTSHRWMTVSTSRCSPRHPVLSGLRDGDTSARNCCVHIGRTSSNVETRSSAKADISALESRRVHSCEYDGRSTSTMVVERFRQLPRVRSPLKSKPSVVLLPPPRPRPPERPASDKVPRYNDTGSFEEVDERLLMLEGFHVDRCSGLVPAAGPGQQTGANVRTLSAGSRSSSVLQNVVGAQYRKLWDLRATLEESADLSDDGQSDLPTTVSGRQPGGAGEKSHGTRPAVTTPSFLPLPYEVRRQTYQHLAVERRLRQPAAASSNAPPGASVDSVEAPETDGDASDTSRYDFTTSLESSTTTTTTTTTDNNTDAGDGRVCTSSSSSTRPPRFSALSAAQVRLNTESQDSRGPEEPDIDGVSRTCVDTTASSSSARRSGSDVSDVAESQVARVELDSSETAPGVAASLRTAAHKRRDFRNERASVQRLALDYDDIHSSTDQPSGDSVDGVVGGVTSHATAASLGDSTPVTRCGPSNALRRFLSYQLRSHSTGTRHLRSRHTLSRDYRLATGISDKISIE